MHPALRLSLPVGAIIVISCSSGSGSTSAPPAAAPAPAPAPSTTAQAPAAGRGAAAPGQAGRGAAAPGQMAGAPPAGAAGAAGGGGGGGRGAPTTPEQRQARRDSIAKVREAAVAQLMPSIAGRENEPAGTVFKNVQVMKQATASQLLTAMDKGIGYGLSRGCNDCHIPGDYASDSLQRKKTARTMLGIVADINANLLPRMGPGRGGQPRTVQCVTCHRGGGAGSVAIIP